MTYIFINQATRYLFIDIINYFAGKGCKVDLYTGEIREGNIKIDDSISKYLLTRYDSSTPFRRLITLSFFTLQVFFKLLFRRKRDIRLILVTTPPFLPFLGIFFNKLFNVPYDLIIYDLYPDVFINFGIFKKESLAVRIWNRLNNVLYTKATKVFTISHFMAERLKEQGCRSEKLITVSNWVDTTYIKPLEKEKNIFIKEHHLENKFVVIYSGNMGATHDLETLINVAADLKGNEDILFLIIGEGVKKQKIEKLVQEKALNNILLLPLQPSEMLPYSLSSGDLAYITLDHGAENASVPGKLFYMLAAGCGIISVALENSELGILTKKYNFGRLFKPGDINSIRAFILDCKRNKDKLIEFQQNAREASLNFTPENASQFYKEIVDV